MEPAWPRWRRHDPYFILYGYFALFMPIFFGMLGFALWVRSWEGRLAERVLPVYVRAGWFSPPEVAALGTLGRRLSARTWARRVAGEAGHTAMRNYQFAATRLALLRDALNRGFHRSPEDLANARHEERVLLEAIDGYRQVFVGRDPLTPRAWWSDGSVPASGSPTAWCGRCGPRTCRWCRCRSRSLAPLPVPAAHTPWLPPGPATRATGGPGQR